MDRSHAIDGCNADLLFVSSSTNGGTKVIELKRTGQQTRAIELWSSSRLRLHHGNRIRVARRSISRAAAREPGHLSAVDVRRFKIHWQERSISKTTVIGGIRS